MSSDESQMPQPSLDSVVDANTVDRPRYRYAILAANLSLLIFCAGFDAVMDWLDRAGLGLASWSLTLQLTEVVGLLAIGPVLVCTVLAAWGPHEAWFRFAWYLAAIAFVSLCESIFDANEFFSVPFAVRYSQALASFASLSSVGIFLLLLIGSWRSYRIGPSDLPSVSLSIKAILFFTLIIGASIRLDEEASRAYWDSLFNGQQSSELFDDDPSASTHYTDYEIERPSIDHLQQACYTAMLGGSIMAVIALSGALAASSWMGRILIVVVPITITSALAFQLLITAGTTPADVTSLMLFCNCLSMFVGGWTAFCVALLKKSGWPFSRRLDRG